MPEKITEGTISSNNIHAEHLVKEVTIIEWNTLQNTLMALRTQVTTLSAAIQNKNKQEEK